MIMVAINREELYFVQGNGVGRKRSLPGPLTHKKRRCVKKPSTMTVTLPAAATLLIERL